MKFGIAMAVLALLAVPVMAFDDIEEKDLGLVEAKLAEVHAQAVVDAKKFDVRHKNTVLAMQVRRGQVLWNDYRSIECRRRRDMTLDAVEAKNVYQDCMLEKAHQRLAELQGNP